MNRGINDYGDWKQRLRIGKPQITHDEHSSVMVDVEEGQALDGIGEDDEKGVEEFEDFGEVEDVGPEEEGTGRRSVGWEADDVSGCDVEDGDCGAD